MNKGLPLIVLMACGLLAASCDHSPAAASTEQVPQQNKNEITLTPAQQALGKIETQPINLSEAPDTLRVAGRIALADDRIWRVGVLTDGIVTTVYAGLGDHVEKGEVLARYHADEVRDARAQYRKSVADSNRLRAAEALAQRMFDRAQLLLSLKAGSVQQMEQARQDLLSAQTALQDAQIEVDRGRDLLENHLHVPADPPPGQPDEIVDNIPILAPASGYIIEKHVTPGMSVETTTDTFVIGDLSQVWMLANVRQENLGDLRVGQTAIVTLPGLPDERFSGKLTNLGQELDEATRVMHVRIVLKNPANRLKPEMFASADIPIGGREPLLLVPAAAVQQVGDQNVLFIRTAPDHFVVRPVDVGETVGGKTPVLEGLKAGEQVVVSGSFVLKSQLLKSTVQSE